MTPEKEEISKDFSKELMIVTKSFGDFRGEFFKGDAIYADLFYSTIFFLSGSFFFDLLKDWKGYWSKEKERNLL